MKSQILHNNSNYIMLSGEIDQNYTVLPDVKITFGAGSTFQGVAVSAGTTLYNKGKVAKHFTLNSLTHIELTPIPGSVDQEQKAEKEKVDQSEKWSEILEDAIPQVGDSVLPLTPKKSFARSEPVTPEILNKFDTPTSDKPLSPTPPIIPPPLVLDSKKGTTSSPDVGFTPHPSTLQEATDEKDLSGKTAEEPCCDCSCIII